MNRPSNTRASPDLSAVNALAVPDEAKVSAFYRVPFWRLGLAAARGLPAGLAWRAGWVLGAGYGMLARQRRQIVEENLLPVLAGDRALARRAARRMFGEFGIKLADLWQFEAGLDPGRRFVCAEGLERLQSARASGRGILLVAFHLGNWELSSPLLTNHGLGLTVLTFAEPNPALTEMRRRARARWGVETVVVGAGSFAFVEVVKRLQDGAIVCLLMDRPNPAGAVPIQLFGRTFLAAAGPAELARASGCAVMATYTVRQRGGYVARLLPEIPYRREELGNRAARQVFTQQVASQFEPLVKRYPQQWFHFVPVWPPPAQSTP